MVESERNRGHVKYQALGNIKAEDENYVLMEIKAKGIIENK